MIVIPLVITKVESYNHGYNSISFNSNTVFSISLLEICQEIFNFGKICLEILAFYRETDTFLNEKSEHYHTGNFIVRLSIMCHSLQMVITFRNVKKALICEILIVHRGMMLFPFWTINYISPF